MASLPKILIADDNQELLNLLARLFEDAGYHVVATTKGRTALDLFRSEKPEVALLDVLLPDMMGYHLAEAIKKEGGIPIIFITGVFKGGKHALDAKQKYGVVSYFEKPFEAKKLIETVASLVPPGSPEAREEDAFEVELDVDVEEERPTDPMELTGLIRVTGGDNISAELKGKRLTATKVEAGHAVIMRPGQEKIADAKPIKSGEAPSRRGELVDNLPSLITAFYLSQETGELGVQRGKVKKVVYFEQGMPVFALSNLVTDRFGQFLVRVGKINENQLRLSQAAAESTKKRMGDVLVEMGLLKETEHLYYVGQQVKSIVYSLFGWEEGIYQMTFNQRARDESIKLDIHSANLIVRGIKKLYKPERLKRLLKPEDRLMPSLQPAYNLSEVELERWEAELLPKIDGGRNVAELMALAGKPEHVVQGFLYSLVALSILERKP